jgi:phosphate transport system substrate-binding protein
MRRSKSLLVVTMFCVLSVSAVSAGELVIVGTGSGVSILKAISEAFTKANPDITIAVPESIGTGGGIKAVGRDEFLLGRVAREIQEKEKPYGLTHVAYAKEMVVFATHQSITVKNLTVQQILDIYSGKITNWKEVGGPDANIRVLRRQEGDAAQDVFRSLMPGFKDLVITEKAKTAFSDPEADGLVASTANLIAFGSYSNLKAVAANILMIDGKGPTDADYPYAVTLGFVYKEANYTGDLKKFVEFATSAAASEAIQAAGGGLLAK